MIRAASCSLPSGYYREVLECQEDPDVNIECTYMNQNPLLYRLSLLTCQVRSLALQDKRGPVVTSAHFV